MSKRFIKNVYMKIWIVSLMGKACKFRVHFESMRIIIFLFGLYLIFACNEKSSEKSNPGNKENTASILDTSKFAIILLRGYGDFPFNKDYSPATLDETDIVKLKILLYQSIDEYNSKLKKGELEYVRVDTARFHYKMQIVPAMNKKGEKEVWINGFCSDWRGSYPPFNQDWKVQLFSVKDGGNCYFNFKINLSTKKWYNFFVNGEA
jgi:hypothetical protein